LEQNTDFRIVSFLGTADLKLQSQYDYVSSSYSVYLTRILTG